MANCLTRAQNVTYNDYVELSKRMKVSNNRRQDYLKNQIAKHLGIAEYKIESVQEWDNVLFVQFAKAWDGKKWHSLRRPTFVSKRALVDAYRITTVQQGQAVKALWLNADTYEVRMGDYSVRKIAAKTLAAKLEKVADYQMAVA